MALTQIRTGDDGDAWLLQADAFLLGTRSLAVAAAALRGVVAQRSWLCETELDPRRSLAASRSGGPEGNQSRTFLRDVAMRVSDELRSGLPQFGLCDHVVRHRPAPRDEGKASAPRALARSCLLPGGRDHVDAELRFYVLLPVMCCGGPSPRVWTARRTETQHITDRIHVALASALVSDSNGAHLTSTRSFDAAFASSTL